MIRIGLIAPKRSGHVFIGNMIKSWVNEVYYRDFENADPKQFANSKEAKDINVVVLGTRDLLNWFASYMVKKEQRTGRINGFDNMVRKWLSITKEFYGETNYLKNFNVYRVLYDRFVSDQKYRKSLCNQLGCRRYNEAMMNVIAVGASGSSFSGFKCDGKADKLDVLTRYKQFEHVNLYKKLFDHFPGLFEFYKEYMGDDDKIKFINEIRN